VNGYRDSIPVPFAGNFEDNRFGDCPIPQFADRVCSSGNCGKNPLGSGP